MRTKATYKNVFISLIIALKRLSQWWNSLRLPLTDSGSWRIRAIQDAKWCSVAFAYRSFKAYNEMCLFDGFTYWRYLPKYSWASIRKLHLNLIAVRKKPISAMFKMPPFLELVLELLVREVKETLATARNWIIETEMKGISVSHSALPTNNICTAASKLETVEM